MKNSMKHGPQSPQQLNEDVRADSVRDDALFAMKSRKRRARARQKRIWVWAQTLTFALASLLLMGAMFSVHAEYRKWQTRVHQREDELAALNTQLTVGQKRLAALQSPQGREQLLIEHGYLRPGDRILEFPAAPEETRQAQLPPNDLAPRSEEWNNASTANGSMWRIAINSLQRRWAEWRGMKPPQIAAMPN